MARDNAEKQFWQWFVLHEEDLLNFETDQENIFDRLSAELVKVNEDLTFEFGPKESQREIIISAGGAVRSFSAVTSLVNAAPSLQRWRLTAFRPRREPTYEVELRGKKVSPEDVQFSPFHNGETIGLYLFIPGFVEGDFDLVEIAYLLLDDALGEFDVGTLGFMKVYPPEAQTNEKRYALRELPEFFDRLTMQLHGRKPS